METIKIGDLVKKVKGYHFTGVVFGIVEDPEEGTRVIVKQSKGWDEKGNLVSGGAKHIFAPEQVEKI